LPARTPQPALGCVPRARPRATPVAQRVPDPARRDGDPPPPLPAPVPAADADAVPRALLRLADGARLRRDARGRASGRRRPARDRRVPLGAVRAPARAV